MSDFLLASPHLIYAYVWAALLAASLWEASSEGENAWDEHKLGWKVRFGKYTILTAYHFWLFGVTLPILVFSPLLWLGWSLPVFLFLFSAYISGLVLQDLGWFFANPLFPLKEWGPERVAWYPWLKLGPVALPVSYVIFLGVACVCFRAALHLI